MIRLIYATKSDIIQYQIEDYTQPIIRKNYIMKNSKQNYRGKKAIQFQKPPKKRGRKPIFHPEYYHKISEYLIRTRQRYKSAGYLKRFLHITPRNLNLVDVPLSLSEKMLYQEISNFHGFFDDLFFLNDLSYFDYVDDLLTQDLIRLGVPVLHDMLIYEFARIQSGNQYYQQFIRNFTFFGPNNFKNLLYDPDFVPTVQDFSRMFHHVPVQHFQEYFAMIINELDELGLLNFRILIWDCQFVHSNSSDYKDRKTGQYSDHEAGLGRHNNKFLGVGYMVSTLYLYCGNLVVPIYCELFPANMNDSPIFRQTMEHYFKLSYPRSEIILADAGPYSYDNLQFIAEHGLIPLINARKNIKHQNIVEISDQVHLNRDFVPKIWTDADLRQIFALRTAIERAFSHNIQLYQARRLNTRGIEQATLHRYLILILDGLKILTSYKVGRPDLFHTYTAFSRMREGVDPTSIRHLLENRGYRLLDDFIELDNPNEMWDDWRERMYKRLRK